MPERPPITFKEIPVVSVEGHEQELLSDFFELCDLWDRLRQWTAGKFKMMRHDLEEGWEEKKPSKARQELLKNIQAIYDHIFPALNEMVKRLFGSSRVQALFKKNLGQEIHSLEEGLTLRQTLLQPFNDRFEDLKPASKTRKSEDYETRYKEALLEATEQDPEWQKIIQKLQFLPGDHREALTGYLAKPSPKTLEAILRYGGTPAASAEDRFGKLELTYTDQDLIELRQLLGDAQTHLKLKMKKWQEALEQEQREAAKREAERRAKAEREEKRKKEVAQQEEAQRIAEMKRRIAAGEIPKEYAELMESESAALQKFFGRKIDVPPLPEPITPERLAEFREKGCEVHFLPRINMTEDQRFPGWKKKPGYWFYERIENGGIARSAVELPGEWFVIDGRQKPAYQNGDQTYANDFLAPILQELNRDGEIRQAKNDGTPLSPTTRFGLSPQELEKPNVKMALARSLGLDPNSVSVPSAIIWNVIGNIHHPEWGNTDTWEWFSDEFNKGRSWLGGGSSDFGGLSHVGAVDDVGYRGDDSGFRLLGRFSR